jgi:MoaA/NifB/PqqE/SkfB family radical SAM enzyme
MITNWHWEVTRRCNLQCLHCVADAPAAELSSLHALEAIQRMAELGARHLYLTGGEPLVRGDIGSLIRAAFFRNMAVEMLTNGTMLSPSFFASGGRFLSRIAVSIDGPREVHDAIRGSGNFDRTLTSIKLIVERHIPFSIFITLNALNRGRLKEVVGMALDLGAASIHMNGVVAGGRAARNRHILLPKGNADAEAAEIFRLLGEMVDTPEPDRESVCTVAKSSMYLNSSGDVFVCSELGLTEPSRRIGGILEPRLPDNIQSFFRNFVPCNCRYTTFEGQGVTLVLEDGRCGLGREA